MDIREERHRVVFPPGVWSADVENRYPLSSGAVAPRHPASRPVPAHARARTAPASDSTKQAADEPELQRPSLGGILAAAKVEHDFGGSMASVAADLGSSDVLTSGRPGSWEADLVQQLVKGTVGWGDEYLADHRQMQTETTA